jgi:hypothetical protein
MGIGRKRMWMWKDKVVLCFVNGIGRSLKNANGEIHMIHKI